MLGAARRRVPVFRFAAGAPVELPQKKPVEHEDGNYREVPRGAV